MDMRRSAGAGLGTMTPVTERNRLLDSLRALALYGVIIMNVGAMVMRFNGPAVFGAAGPGDFIAMSAELVLLQGKARAAFAFLFGLGFGILLVRAAARGQDFGGFYRRRMLALLAIGLVNQAFLFWGDILVTYALLGLLLLAVRNWSSAALLRAGLTLTVFVPVLVGSVEAFYGAPLPGFVEPASGGTAIMMAGDYPAVVAYNFPQSVLRYLIDPAHMLIYAAGVMGLFLLGFWTARNAVHENVERHRPWLRRLASVSIPVGLALSALHGTLLMGIKLGSGSWTATVASAGLPLLALGYVAALALLFQSRLTKLQAVLAPAGRMALTNYLLSGAIGGWILYGYGLGQLRAFDLAGINLLAFGLIAGLTLFSHLWLARFRFGPAEWLWRSASYGIWQPMRRLQRGPALANLAR
jgi:uncharacterized protein